jgi:hypothetical protein
VVAWSDSKKREYYKTLLSADRKAEFAKIWQNKNINSDLDLGRTENEASSAILFFANHPEYKIMIDSSKPRNSQPSTIDKWTNSETQNVTPPEKTGGQTQNVTPEKPTNETKPTVVDNWTNAETQNVTPKENISSEKPTNETKPTVIDNWTNVEKQNVASKQNVTSKENVASQKVEITSSYNLIEWGSLINLYEKQNDYEDFWSYFDKKTYEWQ